MEEPARDAYLELLKQRLTRTYTLGEFRTGGRRHRAVALVMQVLADRGLNDRSSRPVRPSAVRSVRPGPPRVTAPGAHARPAPARNRPRRVAATQTPPYWGRVAGTPRRSCPHRARETGPACRALLPACFEHLGGRVPRRVGRDINPVGESRQERQYRERQASRWPGCEGRGSNDRRCPTRWRAELRASRRVPAEAEWRSPVATKPTNEVIGPRSVRVRVRTAAEHDMVFLKEDRCRKKTVFRQRRAAW
jgi:hypothetical protein